MAGQLPDKVIFRDWNWLGGRLARVISSMDIGPPDALTDKVVGENARMLYHAAKADAEEMAKNQQHEAASNSYHVAIVAARQGNFLQMEEFLNLICSFATSLLEQKAYTKAFSAACTITEINLGFSEGYMLMSKALQGNNKNAQAAVVLVKAMSTCHLSNDDAVRFLVDCSQLLGKDLLLLLRDPQSAATVAPEIADMGRYNPRLPEKLDVWNGIVAKLAEQRKWVGMAVLTVGLGVVPGLLACSLECTCPADVVCSTVHVEDMYQNLSQNDIAQWGDRLALFILNHKGNVGKRTKEPLAIHLAKLSITHGTLKVFNWMLQNADLESLDIDSPDGQGNTALHIVAKSTPFRDFHVELMELMILHGALVSPLDRAGKAPLEYLSHDGPGSKGWAVLVLAKNNPLEGFVQRLEKLKKEGNQAHRAKNSAKALSFYQRAITLIKKSGYQRSRDLAILYNNMAATYASMNNNETACKMAETSTQYDPSYHKPYWRLGKSLAERQQYVRACDKFLLGMASGQADTDQQAQFAQEVCALLSFLTDKEAEPVIKRLKPYLPSSWARIVESLSKSGAWDTIRRLVLGPPEEKVAEQSLVQAGWKFADCYKAGEQKVGYTMGLKSKTVVLHTLVERVENSRPQDNHQWVSDLVLALLMQGADPTTLLPEDEATTWYHIVVFLCCITERLGLMHYILSDDARAKEARVVENGEKRTLLHAVCLHFGDGENMVGRQLVQLLLEKGVNPAVTDVMKKKAADYVAPESTVCKILAKPQGAIPSPDPVPQTSEDMKERGNAEYKKKNYKEAIEFYTQAINLLRKKLPSDILMHKGHEAKKHELAVLFSNRSECHLQLGHVEMAFSDAKDSVSYDINWFRGHIRVGRALVRKNKAPGAVKAFSNAFNALGMDATEGQRKDILKELVKTIVTQSDKPPDRINNLGYVSAELWLKISYDFMWSGNLMAEQSVLGSDKLNEDWRAGQFCLQQSEKAASSLNKLPNIELNLKPLCSWQTHQKVIEDIVKLIIILLQHGSDPTTLSFYEGDTYVHAAACLTVICANSDFLDWMMRTRVTSLQEQNLQDQDGNTALHIFAAPITHRIPPPPLPPTIRFDLCRILINWGVNAKIQNKLGQRAVDCVEKKNKALRDILLKATEKAPNPQPVKTPSPSGSSSTQTVPSPQSSVNPPPSKGPGGKATATGGNRSTNSNVPTETSNSNQRLQCSQCEAVIAEAQDYFARDKSRMGYSKLVSLLGYKHQRDSRHEKFVKQSLDMIVKELGKSLTPDVPDVLLKMAQSHLHKVLERLASQDKWRQMQVVVEKARSNDVPRGTFAKHMSILALLRDKGLCGAEAQRLQILNMLLSHGAQLSPGQMAEAMEVSLQHSEWRLVEQLVEIGVEPRFITLDKHDTPLHAALALALDRDKGNSFSLFEQLVALYEKDPHKYPYLDIRSTDKNNNTLLHLACRAHYSKHSHRAVELLVSKDVPVDVKNADGKTAIEYLKGHDRRTQYLKVAGKQSTVTAAKRKDDANKQRSLSPVPFESGRQASVRTQDGGDNEDSGEEPVSLEGRLQVDRPGFRTKEALTWLTSLVDKLSELTPAEAQLAKSSKGKWLEMGQRLRRVSVSDSEDEDEKSATATAAGDLPKDSGDAPSAEASQQNSDEEEDDEEEEEEKEEGKSEDVEDLMTFDDLDWEVECTAEVWKTLRDQRVTYEMKRRIVRSIRLLASGEWRPQLCRRVHRVPESLSLHQAKFVKGGRILWELAIAFSPRLSEKAEKRIDEDKRKGEFAVRGGRMYTEIIRVWDIVFHCKQQMRPAVQRIIQSHQRGEHCLIRKELKGVKSKELKGVKSQQFKGGGTRLRYPLLFSEADVSEDLHAALQSQQEGKLQLCPPASASEMEFHILKFYCFSSALVYNVLKNLEMKIDFPFRVTDREHAVINLQTQAPILLLGRSGTGKTTCCLYRLWSRFLNYWTRSKDMDYSPWLPRTVQFVADDEPKEEEEEEDPNADLFEGLLEKENKEKSKGASAAAATDSHLSHFSSAADYTDDGFDEEEEEGDEEEEGGEEGEEEEEEFPVVTSHVKYDHLHQLFVTKNQVLCSEVQKNFRELCHADNIAQHHVTVEEAALPHRLQDVDEYKFPLFLTSRQLILILDASLPPPHFFERNEDGSLRVIIHGWGADEEIFAFVPLEDDSDDEDEGEYQEDEQGEDRKEGDSQAGADHHPRKKDNRREVTYSVFAHEVWPKITKKTQVNYHPSLVWTEIMSFIKGSFASLTQPRGYLDQESYEQLGRKQAPNFTGSRHKVYELFQRYTDYKRQHGLYDEADLVFNIYQRLKAVGPLPWVLHEVFVDETQDFTQAELTVLIRLAHSPNNMFLTGDTAQSIMRGVSFRFSDLKTLFHYAKQSLKARGKTSMLEVPRQVYQLTHNYRSHAGILSLASAVLDLLVEFFPESFDRLDKDQGLFDGPQPVVLESGSPADLAILLSGNRRKTSHIEFGAHQVILVVNEEARNNLPEELGLGLVLTIYEAKGLEFDDVLLYNFFKDSEGHKEWRVVTDYLERLSRKEASASSVSSGLVEIDEDVLHQVGRPRPLNFDPNLHKILNSELKHLYTAVTRARVNVWIFDQDSDKRAPMFEYFKARKLVKMVSMKEGLDDTGVSQSIFAEKSSAEEWEKRGDEIMHRSLYDVAAKCYAMAGAKHKQDIAVAHQRALKASHLRAQPRQMRDEFLKAAVLFLECHRDLLMSSSTLALRYNLVMKAGRCLQNARENHLAALVFEKNGQLEVAGPLYLRARKWLAASQCFEHVDNFGRALKILDEQELYDQAIDCLQRYNIRKQDFEKKGMALPKALVDHRPEGSFTVASLSYKAAKFYHRYKETQKMLAAIERLPNREEQIKFLQKHGFLQDAALLMRSDGRIAEATRMMLQNGQVDKAMKIADEGTDSGLRAQCYLVKAQQLLESAASRRDKQEAAKAQTDRTLTGNGEDGSSVDPPPNKQKETQGSKKTSPPKSGKKKDSEPLSSDDDDDDGSSSDNNQQQVVERLERACQQFDVCKDYSGMGECQLLLSEVRDDRNMLEKSFTNFETAQPVANSAGMLECVEALHKIAAENGLDFKSCGKLIWGVEKVFDAVRILLQPTSAEDKNRYQVFLSYYGLERSGDAGLVFYPKLKPRFVRMIGKRHVFNSKEEKKEERLHRSAQEVVSPLAHFLIQRTKDWCQCVQYFLEIQLPSVLHCASFQEGRVCDDEEFCPYLHDIYTQETTYDAITVLSSQVRLDQALQSGAESLSKIDIMLSELTLSLPQQERIWHSVETLLEFIFPTGLITYNMTAVLEFCLKVARKEPTRAGVHHQIERYLQYLWRNPGRVGKGRSQNVLKERCKSSAWMVLASLLVPLFKLDIKVDQCCKEVELQLNKEWPKWMQKRHKYALLTDEDMVIFLARRHLDALHFLQPDHFDPFEAVIKFTKFVKLLLDRREISLFPDLSIFLFWMEVFVTIALCLALKLRGGRLYLPGCYLRLLRLFNLTLPQARRGDFWRRMEEFRPFKNQTLKLLHNRIEVLALMMYGNTPSSFCLLNHLLYPRKKRSNTFVLAERSVILTLTLLVNVEQGNVPPFCERPILHWIHNVKLEDNKAIPPRLAQLISQVQQADNYRHVMVSLTHCLSNLSERAGFYQWRWSKEKAEGLMPVNVATVQAGGPFHHFRPEARQGGGLEYAGGVPEAMDEIDDVDQQRNMEEEEEIDEEEKAAVQQQIDEAQQEERNVKAVKILVRFFRSIRFKKHFPHMRWHYLQQSEREMFSPFTVTDKMCGICGVRFEKSSEKPQVPVSAEGNIGEEGVEEGAEEVEDERDVIARLKQDHVTSEEHRRTNTNFGTFRHIYRQFIVMPLMEIGAFLAKREVKQQRTTWYKGLVYQVDNVLGMIETLQQMVDQALQDRNWVERDKLIAKCSELGRFFQEQVHEPVEKCFKFQQDQRTQTAATKEAEKQHQEKLMDGMVEEPSMADILNVVDQPLHGTGPNAQGRRGTDRGRGRGHWGGSRGQRRGDGGHRPQGAGGGYRNQGPVGDGQFEKGDLPPRFRRHQR